MSILMDGTIVAVGESVFASRIRQVQLLNVSYSQATALRKVAAVASGSQWKFLVRTARREKYRWCKQ